MSFRENSRFMDGPTRTSRARRNTPGTPGKRSGVARCLALAMALALMLALAGCGGKDIEVLQEQPTPTTIPEPTHPPEALASPSPSPIADAPPAETPVAEDSPTSPVEGLAVPETSATTLTPDTSIRSDIEDIQARMGQTDGDSTEKAPPVLPEGFPPDAPQIEEARIIETYHEDEYFVLSLEADMRPMAAIAKYGNELRQAGWEYRRFQIEGDVKSLLYEKGDRFTKIEVYDGGDNERALINLLVTAEEE